MIPLPLPSFFEMVWRVRRERHPENMIEASHRYRDENEHEKTRTREVMLSVIGCWLPWPLWLAASSTPTTPFAKTPAHVRSPLSQILGFSCELVLRVHSQSG